MTTPKERVANALNPYIDEAMFESGEMTNAVNAVLSAIAEPSEAMVTASEIELFRQYEENGKWDDAKEVIENIDIIKLLKAAAAAMMAEKDTVE